MAISEVHGDGVEAVDRTGGRDDGGLMSLLRPTQELEARTRCKGFELRQRLPVYPEFLPRLKSSPELLSSRLNALADANGFARPTA